MENKNRQSVDIHEMETHMETGPKRRKDKHRKGIQNLHRERTHMKWGHKYRGHIWSEDKQIKKYMGKGHTRSKKIHKEWEHIYIENENTQKCDIFGMKTQMRQRREIYILETYTEKGSIIYTEKRHTQSRDTWRGYIRSGDKLREITSGKLIYEEQGNSREVGDT